MLEHYGDILFKAGKEKEAVGYWLKAKEFGGESELLTRKIKEQKYIDCMIKISDKSEIELKSLQFRLAYWRHQTYECFEKAG